MGSVDYGKKFMDFVGMKREFCCGHDFNSFFMFSSFEVYIYVYG